MCVLYVYVYANKRTAPLSCKFSTSFPALPACLRALSCYSLIKVSGRKEGKKRRKEKMARRAARREIYYTQIAALSLSLSVPKIFVLARRRRITHLAWRAAEFADRSRAAKKLIKSTPRCELFTTMRASHFHASH